MARRGPRATFTWSYTNPMAASPGGHTATLLPNGYVLVAVGDDPDDKFYSCELYNPVRAGLSHGILQLLLLP